MQLRCLLSQHNRGSAVEHCYVCVAAVAFSSVEQELYMHVFERARTKYQMFRSQGPHMVSKRLIQIMSTLLPLRRICSGGQLSDKDLAVVSSLLVPKRKCN